MKDNGEILRSGLYNANSALQYIKTQVSALELDVVNLKVENAQIRAMLQVLESTLREKNLL